MELPDFPRMTYAVAMAKYGSDKPDLRVKLELTELTDVVRNSGFKVFVDAANLKNGKIAALRVPGGNAMFARRIGRHGRLRRNLRRKGPAYIKVNDATKPNAEGLQSPIVKFFDESTLPASLAACSVNHRRPHFLLRRQDQGRVRHTGCPAPRSAMKKALRKKATSLCGWWTSGLRV